jgi:hypothetical protein
MQPTPRFWPLDYDPDGEIYENLAWDLPGRRIRRVGKSASRVSRNRQFAASKRA